MVALRSLRSGEIIAAWPVGKMVNDLPPAASEKSETDGRTKKDRFMDESTVLALHIRVNRTSVTIDEMELTDFLVWYEGWLSRTEWRVKRIVAMKNKIRKLAGKKPSNKNADERLLCSLRCDARDARAYRDGDQGYVRQLKWYLTSYLFSMSLFTSFCVFKTTKTKKHEVKR